MKKLLLATVALLLTTPAVSADRVKLPPEILGAWCATKQPGHYERGNCRQRGNVERIVIGPDGYEGTEHGCKTVSSTVRKDTYVLHYRCDGEGWTWTEDAEMRL